MDQLSRAHHTSSTEFWPVAARLHKTLIHAGDKLRLIACGCSPSQPSIRRDPIDPDSYVAQREDIGEVIVEGTQLGRELAACTEAGKKLIRIVSNDGSDQGVSAEEYEAVQNEVNGTINDLNQLYNGFMENCRRLEEQVDIQEKTAKKFKVRFYRA